MPALIATIGATRAPFTRELKTAEAEAASAGKVIEQNLEGGTTPLSNLKSSGATRELLVLIREISRGNWTRVSGSLSILIQRLGLLKYILTPTVGLLTAIGVAAGYLAFHFKRLADSTENAYQSMNVFHRTISATAEAFERATSRAEEYAEALRKLNEPSDTAVSDVDDRIKSMREEYELQERIAKAKAKADEDAAQSPEDKAHIRAAEAQREHDARIKNAADESNVIHEARDKAVREAADARADLIAKQKAASAQAAGATGDAFIEDQEKRYHKLKEIADAVEAENRGKERVHSLADYDVPVMGSDGKPLLDYRGLPVTRNANDDNGLARHMTKQEEAASPKTVKVGSESFTLSLNQATTAMTDVAKQIADAKAAQKRADDDVKQADERARKSKGDADKLSRQTVDAAAAISRAQREPIETETEFRQKDHERNRILRGSVNSLQSVGAYAMPGVVEMLDVQKRSEAHLRSIDHKLGSLGRVGGGEGHVGGAKF